jgi:seryl-tRNA synthetase
VRGLPAAVQVKLCSGDVGFSARLCYDLEVRTDASHTYLSVARVFIICG